MRYREGPKRPQRVDEQRMGTIERVDEPATVVNPRPARRLDRAGDFQRQFVKVLLPLVERNFTFAHQAEQIAEGGDIVESVIVDADVREVGRHALEGVAPADFQERFLAGGIELQQRRAELKPLRPLGPPTGGVSASYREDRRAAFGFPALLEVQDFSRGKLEQPLNLRDELLRADTVVDFDGHGSTLNRRIELGSSPIQRFNGSTIQRLTIFSGEIHRPR